MNYKDKCKECGIARIKSKTSDPDLCGICFAFKRVKKEVVEDD